MKNSENRAGGSRGVLGHPAFLSCLGLLLLNDHLLKGAGILPVWMTGKLSDLVGPVVAIGLVCALFKVQKRSGMLAAAVAVGVPFAAINLSESAAAVWSALMSSLGFPWQVVTDPTDLVGLLAIPFGLWLVARAQREATPRRWTIRQLAVATIAAVACVATSPPVDPFEGFIFTEVGILNNTPNNITVRLRPLRGNVVVDCAQVAEDPRAFLSNEVFGEGITWEIPPKEQVPADDGEPRPCHAVLVEVDGLTPTMIFWRDLFELERPVPLPRRQNAGPQTISIEREGEAGMALFDAGSDGLIQGPLTSVYPTPTGECEVVGPGFALTWSEPVPKGNFILREASIGPDECVTVALLDPLEAAVDWTICLPGGQFPFESGDRLLIDHNTDHSQGYFETIALSRQNEDDPALDLVVSVGQRTRSPFNLVIEPGTVDSCEGDIDTCGTYRRAGQLEVISPGQEKVIGAAGDHLQLDLADARIDVHIGRVSERLVLNAQCEAKNPNLGMEIEYTAIRTEIAEEGNDDEGE